MIKSLRIINFGPHADTTLEFHSNVNIIVGSGCAGKTSIIRALKLLRFYRPNNFRFHSHFAKSKSSKVIVKTNDDTKIKLEKTKKKAKYSIVYPNGKIQSFRKFKSTVPDDVINALNIHDINFQYQLDSPYILSESSGKITKIINDITKINSVNSWIKKLNSLLKEKQTIYRDSKDGIKDVNKQLSKLRNLKLAKKYIDKSDKIQKRIDKLNQKFSEIQSVKTDIQVAEKRIEILNRKLKAQSLYDIIESYNKKIDKLKNDNNQVEEYIERLNNISRYKKKFRIKNKIYIKKIKKLKRCPFCYSKIGEYNIKEIKNEIGIII